MQAEPFQSKCPGCDVWEQSSRADRWAGENVAKTMIVLSAEERPHTVMGIAVRFALNFETARAVQACVDRQLTGECILRKG